MRNRNFTALTLLVMLLSACDSTNDTERYNGAEQTGAKPQQEWRSYLAGSDFSHHSSLEQIHRGDVNQLEVTWRYRAGGAADNGTTQMQCNPLVVKGILYGSSPTLHVFALNAATGAELWRFDPNASNDRLLPNPNRGLVYWERGSEQRILFTAGSFLYALNARTGRLVHSFGVDGAVDLHEGLPEWAQDTAVIATTPGSVYKDLLILGSRVSEFRGAAPGHIRTFDVSSGELRWIFHTIPQAGEFGADTWPEESRKTAGGANSWAGIAIDHERGIAFAPTGSATIPSYWRREFPAWGRRTMVGPL